LRRHQFCHLVPDFLLHEYIMHIQREKSMGL
jgi:hypothetical protein